MAKAKAFEFKPGDRKFVPGLAGVQGVITQPASGSDFATAPKDADGRYHLAFMRWFDERGQAQTGWFTVPQVQEVNPAPAVGSWRPVPVEQVAAALVKLGTKPKTRARKR